MDLVYHVALPFPTIAVTCKQLLTSTLLIFYMQSVSDNRLMFHYQHVCVCYVLITSACCDVYMCKYVWACVFSGRIYAYTCTRLY